MPKQLNELIEKKNYEELIFDSEIIVNIALQIKYYWGLLVEKEFIPQEKNGILSTTNCIQRILNKTRTHMYVTCLYD